MVQTEYGLWRKCSRALPKKRGVLALAPPGLDLQGGWLVEGGNATKVGEWECVPFRESFLLPVVLMSAGARAQADPGRPCHPSRHPPPPLLPTFSATRSECEQKGTGDFCVVWSTAGYLSVVPPPLCPGQQGGKLTRASPVRSRFAPLARERGLLSLLPLLVACVALVVISLGAGERQVRKDRREVGWKGVAGCTLFSGPSRTPFPLGLARGWG